MALIDSSILSVNIALDIAPVTEAGFGTVMFIDNEQWFEERQRVYTPSSDLSDLPVGSRARAVVSSAFLQDIKPDQFILGRQRSDATFTPINVADGVEYTLTITVNDGDSVVASYTAGVAEDEEDVCVGLKADIDAVTAVTDHITATINGTGAGATLTIAANTAADDYYLSAINEDLTVAYTSTESAEATLSNILVEGDTAFYITYHDHTEAEILAMAAAVESRQKVYMWSVADANTLTAWDGVTAATDTGAKLVELGYQQSPGMWHHDADTVYPEVLVTTYFAVYQPGTIDWDKRIVVGLSLALSGGFNLTSTQLGYLESRNMGTSISFGGQTVFADGKVPADFWIDQITSKFFIIARVSEAWQRFQINSPKISGTNTGIAASQAVIEGVLNKYVDADGAPNIFSSDRPIKVTLPSAAERQSADISSRTLVGSFEAVFANSIQNLKLVGRIVE